MELYFSQSISWCQSYRRNNKSDMIKNVLCFPNHSNGAHKSEGFCGEMVKVEILTSLDYEEFPYLIVGEFSSILKNNVSLKPQDLISTDDIFTKNSYRKFYYGTVVSKEMLDESIWRYEVHVNKELKAWNYPYKTSKNQDYNCHCFFVYVLAPVDEPKRLFQCITRIQSPPFQIRCSRRNSSNDERFKPQNKRNSFNILYKQSQLMKLVQQQQQQLREEEILPPDNVNNNNNNTSEEDDEEEISHLNINNNHLNDNNDISLSPSPSSSSSPDTENIFDELDDISNIGAAKCPMSKYYSNYTSFLSVDNNNDSSNDESENSPVKKCPYLARQKQQRQLNVPPPIHNHSTSSNVTIIPDTYLKSTPPHKQTQKTPTNERIIDNKARAKLELIKDDDKKGYKSCCESNYLFPLLPIIVLFFIVMIMLVYIDSMRSNSYTSVLGEKLMIYQLLLRQLSYHYSCYSDIIKYNGTIAKEFISKPFEYQINELLRFEKESLPQSCHFLLYSKLSDENCNFSPEINPKNSNLQFYFIIGVLIVGLFLHMLHKYILMVKLRSNK